MTENFRDEQLINSSLEKYDERIIYLMAQNEENINNHCQKIQLNQWHIAKILLLILLLMIPMFFVITWDFWEQVYSFLFPLLFLIVEYIDVSIRPLVPSSIPSQLEGLFIILVAIVGLMIFSILIKTIKLTYHKFRNNDWSVKK